MIKAIIATLSIFGMTLFCDSVFSKELQGKGSFVIAPTELLVRDKSVSVQLKSVGRTIQSSPTSFVEEVEAYNGQSTTLYVTATVKDWSMDEEGNYAFHDAGTLPHSCSEWIQIQPSQFVVQPGESVHARVKITTPFKIQNEHRAMIFFEGRMPPQAIEKMGVNMVLRIGCNVLVQPLAPTPSVKATALNLIEVQNQSATDDASPDSIHSPDSTQPTTQAETAHLPENNTLETIGSKTTLQHKKNAVEIKINNSGAISTRVHGTVEISSSTGNLKLSKELTPSLGRVMPGGHLIFRTEPFPELPAGEYFIKAIIRYAENETVIVQAKRNVGIALTNPS